MTSMGYSILSLILSGIVNIPGQLKFDYKLVQYIILWCICLLLKYYLGQKFLNSKS